MSSSVLSVGTIVTINPNWRYGDYEWHFAHNRWVKLERGSSRGVVTETGRSEFGGHIVHIKWTLLNAKSKVPQDAQRLDFEIRWSGSPEDWEETFKWLKIVSA